MENYEALAIAVRSFAPVEESDWEAITESASWDAFLNTLNSLANGNLDEQTRAALAKPPSFQQKAQFARRHFTGGLPASALPVESLYLPPVPGAAGPSYLRETALYMRELVEAMEIPVPDEFSAMPDHLSIELAVVATLLAINHSDEATEFMTERLTWLPAYTARLEQLDDGDAGFYIALTKALSSIAAKES